VTDTSHIGQYRIVRRIGAGGMGLVFLAEHTLLGRRAAIKTLLPSVATNPGIVERFFNEARATSAISDPGVIQIFDFGYHVDGTAYIVMELLEGESLSARIARLGRLSPANALRIARQIAGSLAAAHAHDIVHRDLKPENVFLVCDAEAQGGERTKILDFGICKVGTGDPMLSQAGAMIGTPVYMSPEQCRGARDVDHRADIYAFGCLLFHMLTGRPPFMGDATGELIVAHLEEDPPAPSRYAAELSPEIDALVRRCLAKAPADRYPSMTDLQHVLGDLYADLEGSEIAVASVPPKMPLGRGFRSVYDGNVTARARSPAHGVTPAERGMATRKVLMTPRMRPTPSQATPTLMIPPPSAPTVVIPPPSVPTVLIPSPPSVPTVLIPPTPAPTVMIPPPPPPIQMMAPASGVLDASSPRRRVGVFAVLGCVLVAGVAIGLLTTSLVVASQADPGRPSPARISPAAITTSVAPDDLHAAAAIVDREPVPVRPIAPPVEAPRSPARGLPRSPARRPVEGSRALHAPAAVAPPRSPPAPPPAPPVRTSTAEDLYDTR
jgi:serine/threonine protein kinase